MWFFLYNLLSFLFSPIIIMILMVKKRCRPGLAYRLGICLPAFSSTNSSIIWIHAVSLGEALAVAPFIQALHARYPQASILVSTVTETGREVVLQRFGRIAHHSYFPLDWPWVVERFVSRVKPAVFIIIETELWPNVLKRLEERGVPTILVNGRLSSRSFKRYLWIRPFMSQILSKLSLVLVQTERDKERFIELGVSPERVHRTGSMKFDQALPEMSQSSHQMGESIIPVEIGGKWIIAGSTHFEEEMILLRIFQEIINVYPDVNLMLAPRHIERADKLEEAVREKGFKVLRRTTMGNPNEIQGSRVVILDTRGELAQVYRWASLTFVGGTLIPVGGHNLLEPARWAKPVYFGPYTDHCQDIARLLVEAGGGVQVQDEHELLASLMHGLSDQAWRERVGDAAKEVVLKNQGVVKRNLTLISEIMDSRLTSNR